MMNKRWFYTLALIIFGAGMTNHVQAEWGGLDGLAQLKEGRTQRASSCHEEWTDTNQDAVPIAAGETLEIANLEGPGVIQHIWNTYTPGELATPRLLVIRMYWDGEEHPSVEAPLGDFFAVGHGLNRDVTSAPVSVGSHGRARNCYWPMPFGKSARITITNESRSNIGAFFWYVDWQQLPSLPEDTAYFHAQYRQEFPADIERNYTIAEIEGRGHYVGTVYSIREFCGGWFGEGDDFFFIDGEETPSLRGTGSEDYLCDAWGLRALDRPYYGVSVYDGMATEHARTTAYRWHIMDPVNFETSLRVEIEHKGGYINEDGEVISHFMPRPDELSSVAFWYQLEPHKSFGPIAFAYDRIYHDPADVQETEAVMEELTYDNGRIDTQYGPWSGMAQVMWVPSEDRGSLTVPFTVDEAGTHTLTAFLTLSMDYGIYDLSLNGKTLKKNVDLFAGSFYTDEFRLGKHELAAGKHLLTFTIVGKNPQSVNYLCGVDCLLVEKVEE